MGVKKKKKRRGEINTIDWKSKSSGWEHDSYPEFYCTYAINWKYLFPNSIKHEWTKARTFKAWSHQKMVAYSKINLCIFVKCLFLRSWVTQWLSSHSHKFIQFIYLSRQLVVSFILQQRGWTNTTQLIRYMLASPFWTLWLSFPSKVDGTISQVKVDQGWTFSGIYFTLIADPLISILNTGVTRLFYIQCPGFPNQTV